MMEVEPAFRDSDDPKINDVESEESLESPESEVDNSVLMSRINELESTVLELRAEITRLKAVNYDLLTSPSGPVIEVEGDVGDVEDDELDLYDLFKE